MGGGLNRPWAPRLAEPAELVAPTLLGCLLTHAGVTVRLTEVEAYAGERDPASHAARGRTPRNQVMYGPAGRLYVYFSYGMHWCANVVTGPDGVASAVLLRAGAVVDGVEVARQRRPAVADAALGRGPACLTKILALTGADSGAVARLAAAVAPYGEVLAGPRVGIRAAADVPWRFWLAGERSVSAYRAAVARPCTGGSAS